MATLPDYLRRGMKLMVVGCNPGDRSARVGHHYAGRGNQFWPLLYDSGILPELLDSKADNRVIEFGIGLTDLVKRATRGIEELERQEIAEGRIGRASLGCRKKSSTGLACLCFLRPAGKMPSGMA
jgi:mismatch-specific thymine-DNA glycosylase